MTASQKTKIIDMRKNGASYKKVAETVGLPIGTIKSFCHRAGIIAQVAISKLLCKNCGLEITEESKTKPRLFCCDKCKQVWWNKKRGERQSEKMVIHHCKTCGQPFADYESLHRKYCSQLCFHGRSINDDEC